MLGHSLTAANETMAKQPSVTWGTWCSRFQRRLGAAIDRVHDPAFGVAMVVAMVVAGIAMRAAVAVNDPLWLDELHTSWVVADDWSEVVDRAARGHQTPLYFFAVKAITDVFGHSEWNLRVLSLISGAALLFATAYWVFRWTGSLWSAGVSAALLATDETSIFYASEARPYALLQLVALIQAALLLERTFDFDRRWSPSMDVSPRRTQPWLFWATFVAISFAMVFIHPTALLLLAAEVTVLIIFGFVCVVNRWMERAKVHSDCTDDQPKFGPAGQVDRTETNASATKPAEFMVDGDRARTALAVPRKRNPCARWLLPALVIVFVASTSFRSIPGIEETWEMRYLWSEISDVGALLTGDLQKVLAIGTLTWLIVLFMAGWRLPRIWPWLRLVFLVGGLFVVTTLAAAALELSGIAPLAYNRYTVVALVFGWISLAVVVSAPLGLSLLPTVVAIAIVGLVHLNIWPRIEDREWLQHPRESWLVEQCRFSPNERWRMRFEDWKGAIAEADRQRQGLADPVLILPRILELDLLGKENLPLERDDERLIEYLCFPVRGIYRFSNPDNISVRADKISCAPPCERATDGTPHPRIIIIDRVGPIEDSDLSDLKMTPRLLDFIREFSGESEDKVHVKTVQFSGMRVVVFSGG